MFDLPPELPPQHAQIVITAKLDRIVGVCHLIDARSELRLGAVNSFSPSRSVEYYLKTVEQRYFKDGEGKVTILQKPKHGEIEGNDRGSFGYFPNAQNYVGPNNATFLVEIGDLKIKAIYFFNVLPKVPGGTEGYDPYEDKKLCPNGKRWKISLNTKLSHNTSLHPTPQTARRG